MVGTPSYLSPGFAHLTRLGRQAPNGCALRASNLQRVAWTAPQ